MVKTHSKSRFVLYSLQDIRNSREVILQIENTGTQFDNGHKCYLCEVVSEYNYNLTPRAEELQAEILTLNKEKRKLVKKVERLERELKRIEHSTECSDSSQSRKA